MITWATNKSGQTSPRMYLISQETVCLVSNIEITSTIVLTCNGFHQEVLNEYNSVNPSFKPNSFDVMAHRLSLSFTTLYHLTVI